MTQKTRSILIASLIFILLALVLPFWIAQKLPSRETLQELIASVGIWGPLVFGVLGIVTTVIPPLTFTLPALAGGFVFGTGPAFLMLYIVRNVGNTINYLLGKRYGRRIVRLFVNENEIENYDRFMRTEKAVMIYFVLCFLPGGPGDYAAYFIGSSALRKRIFIPITLIANAGSTFSLAYIGSGKAFSDPLFLFTFAVVFISGLLWIHQQRKAFHLR